METLAIETKHLRKLFDRTVAVKGLTLDVRRGEVFGFLGPNGAGKSTSVKMLLGLVKPTGGSALVLGKPAGDAKPGRRSVSCLNILSFTIGLLRRSSCVCTGGCMVSVKTS